MKYFHFKENEDHFFSSHALTKTNKCTFFIFGVRTNKAHAFVIAFFSPLERKINFVITIIVNISLLVEE